MRAEHVRDMMPLTKEIKASTLKTIQNEIIAAAKAGQYSLRVSHDMLHGTGYDYGNPDKGPDEYIGKHFRELGYTVSQFSQTMSIAVDIGMIIDWKPKE